MAVLSANIQKLVEDNLLKDGLLTEEKLKELKDKAENNNTPLFSLLVNDGIVTNETLTHAIAKTTRVPYVNLSKATINPEVLALLPRDLAERYMAVPLGEMQHHLVVAMLDADNVQAVDFLANKIGRPLKVYSASEEGIRNILGQYKGEFNSNVTNALIDQKDIEDVVIDDSEKEDIETISQDSPISKIITAIMEYAVGHRASDIHIEPQKGSLKIRCRVDGLLREVMKLPKSTEPPIISRIKILSNLKIDEHRIPQDGQFTIKVLNHNVDLRVAISPVVWGEQVVIRLLDKSGTSLKLENLGYYGRSLRTIREGLKHPNGMILTSGPTGSGKTTSMYALIQEIKNDTVNIVTLEDPVEYKMDGVNQIQINADVGLTFATGLRSILRQDPNIVMVGEIRDKETAQLAVQSALTGHLVLSTLHTNSAAGILPRLLDMGIEPFLIASTVHTVIGQRLVRSIPEEISESYQSDIAETEAIKQTIGNLLPTSEKEQKSVGEDLGFENLPLKSQNAYTLYKGQNSPDNPGGYKGRVGLYEAFNVSEKIQDLILKQATSGEIQKAAQSQGMITMRQDGYLKALSGMSSLIEINRVAVAETT